MRQTVDKGVGQPLYHLVAEIILSLVMYIEHRFLYLSHAMAQQIDSHHGQRIAVGSHVLRITVLSAQILAEAQCLRFQPCLLQLYKDDLHAAVVLSNLRSEVDAEDRQCVALLIGVLMGSQLHFQHFLLKEGRENGACHSFVFHEVFEDNVVNGIGYGKHIGIVIKINEC